MTDYLTDIIRLPNYFTGANLTETISRIEGSVVGISHGDCRTFLKKMGVNCEALDTAAELKRLTSQIDVTIHALGILLCLPYILDAEEVVEYVSLGAGNTGRKFDLETNCRVAEFKFIHWRGGAESIRQNSTFKDFYLLEEDSTQKRKYLYLLKTRHALNFLQGGRKLRSILSRNNKLREMFFDRFGDRFETVGEYYTAYHRKVEITDISQWLPELIET